MQVGQGHFTPMKLRSLAFAAAWLLVSLVAGAALVPAWGATDALTGFPVVAPEAVGFSTKRLERLDAAIQRTIDHQDFAGVVVMAARHGKLFLSRTYGERDTSVHDPIQKDTIMRLYSMSKPLTGVAMMILYEEGKWSAQDPISKYIPEFSHLKVVKSFDAKGQPILEEPEHTPMMRELMTHTAGFAGGSGTTPQERLYQDGHGHNRIITAANLQEMIDRLAQLPLIYQPGQAWYYGVSVEIQGYIIQKISGESFPDYLKHHLFDPLQMKDSGFYVPAGKLGRFSPNYRRTDAGVLQLIPPQENLLGTFETPPTLPLGGGGMVSTAPDYLRFAQMLLAGGELNGVRILGPETIRMMSANHLAPGLMTGQWGGGIHRMRPGLGFGFDFAVYTDPALADETTGKGTYLWIGAAGTCFWVDPTHDIVFVGMVQRMASDERPNLEALTRQTFYQALVRPEL